MKLIYLLWKAPYRYARLDSKEKHELIGVYETKRKASCRGRQIMKETPGSLMDHQWYWVEEREGNKVAQGKRVWPAVEWYAEVNFGYVDKPWTEEEVESTRRKLLGKDQGESEFNGRHANLFTMIHED